MEGRRADGVHFEANHSDEVPQSGHFCRLPSRTRSIRLIRTISEGIDSAAAIPMLKQEYSGLVCSLE